MRVVGIKLIPLIISSALIYVVGALIYGALFSAQWMALSGYTDETLAPERWRMALSPIMPIMISLGVGILMQGRGVGDWRSGLGFGLIIGLFFLVGGRLYNFAYGNEPVGLLVLDSVHLLANGGIAGLVLGGLKAAD